MKQIEVTIMGQSYVLGCPEGGESLLLEAVAAVDREMCAIRDAGRVRARERIAVLAALNLAYAMAQRPQAPSAPEASAVDLDALIRQIDQTLDANGRYERPDPASGQFNAQQFLLQHYAEKPE